MDAIKLTRKDARALWHAVDDMVYMHRGMQADPPMPREIIAEHGAKLQAARSALLKVQKIVRAAASIGEGK